ncbi:MAG: nucleotide exchange factor GrpE [Verrucomicrobiota bacterium]
MTESALPRIAKWPFLVGDLTLLAAAGFAVKQTAVPFDFRLIALCVAAVAIGAILGVVPFLAEYRAAVKLAESQNLVSTVAQIQNLESVGQQIATTGAKLHSVIDEANKAVTASDEIGRRMTDEARNFAEFMQKANDAEKAHLRLEADKLRRAESDWLQIVVRLLDYGFLLHQNLRRTGQPALIDEVTRFQNASRDVARRVGLIPFIATTGETFDSKKHQLMEGAPAAADGALIADTVAAGYTYQGQLIRPAVVVLTQSTSTVSPAEAVTTPADQQALL